MLQSAKDPRLAYRHYVCNVPHNNICDKGEELICITKTSIQVFKAEEVQGYAQPQPR